MQCTKCGGAVLPTGACSQCGYSAHTELEIAAFMTPHINRARIVLVGIGIIFAIVGYRAYGRISDLRDAVNAYGDANDPELEEIRSAVTFAYVVVVFVMCAGVANILLALIAGKKTMLAFNAAGAIFLVHTGLQMYVGGAAVFTNILWWITAICLGMGYMAALKAERLRRGTPPGSSPTF